jgi:DNA-binding IclR family transcriptional regulator
VAVRNEAVHPKMSIEDATEIVKRLRLERFTEKTFTTREALMQEVVRTKRRGYAVDNEEREDDVCCVAMPTQDENGSSVAAVSISGPPFA